jgi:hypothetical protein
MEKPEAGWLRSVLTLPEENSHSFKNEDRWAATSDVLNEDNPLWRQYVVLVDLYKFYIEVAWRVSVWYYAITALVLAYFFDHIGDQGSEALPLILVFLAAMSAGFAYLHWRGARHLHSMIGLLEYIAQSLRLPGRPHIEFAAAFLLINCFMFAAVCVASLVLFLSVAKDLQIS